MYTYLFVDYIHFFEVKKAVYMLLKMCFQKLIKVYILYLSVVFFLLESGKYLYKVFICMPVSLLGLALNLLFDLAKPRAALSF